MKKIEFALKNILLEILLFFNSTTKKTDKVILAPGSKVLFIRLNKIGDALVTTPLLKLIKSKTGCKIKVLADKKNHFIFKDPQIAEDVIIFEKGIGNFRKLISDLNSEKYDAVIDLHDDISTTVSFLVALLKIPVKIGLRKGNERIYTHLVDKLQPSVNHIVTRVMEFSKIFSLNYNPDEINIHYQYSQNSLNIADSFLEKKNNSKYLIGINISAGSEARFWGVSKFKDIIRFFNKYDADIIILSAENEKKYAEEISENQYPVFTNPDFNVFAAMISKLDFLFTPDTSIVHLASAYEIPMFGIYVKYNTSNMIWSPFKSKFDCVITEEPNFENLDFDFVKEKLLTFFEKIYEQRNTKM